MARNLIGTVTTDSNGEATFTYTGGGLGRIGFSAEHGTFQSEIFVVEDTLFYDVGIGSTANTKWDTVYVTRSVESNGTKFIVTSTNASARASMNPVDNASAYDFPAQPMVFECELVDFYVPSNAIGMQFFQLNPTVNKQINLQTSDIGHKLEVRYDGTEMRLYKDGERTSRYQTCTFDQTMRVGFTFNTEGGYVVVKNVKAYPI